MPIVHGILVRPDSRELLPQLLRRIDSSCGLEQDPREAALASPSVSAPQVGSNPWFVRTAALLDGLRNNKAGESAMTVLRADCSIAWASKSTGNAHAQLPGETGP